MPVTSPAETRTCTRCRRELPVSEFRWRSDRQSYVGACRGCEADYAKAHRIPVEIPVGTFQRRYRYLLRRGVTSQQIARNLGWCEPGLPDTPNTQRLRRAIGLEPHWESKNGKREKKWRKTIKPATAKRLAEAMYCDPVDLGF